MYLNSSGLARAMLEDYKKAYEELKQSLNILKTCLGTEHVEVADCYANLGDVCTPSQHHSTHHNTKTQHTSLTRVLCRYV